MKTTRILLPFAPLLPIPAVAVLIFFGITFSTWVYLLIALICPFIAGMLWFIYRDAGKKVNQAKGR